MKSVSKRSKTTVALFLLSLTLRQVPYTKNANFGTRMSIISYIDSPVQTTSNMQRLLLRPTTIYCRLEEAVRKKAMEGRLCTEVAGFAWQARPILPIKSPSLRAARLGFSILVLQGTISRSTQVWCLTTSLPRRVSLPNLRHRNAMLVYHRSSHRGDGRLKTPPIRHAL